MKPQGENERVGHKEALGRNSEGGVGRGGRPGEREREGGYNASPGQLSSRFAFTLHYVAVFHGSMVSAGLTVVEKADWYFYLTPQAARGAGIMEKYGPLTGHLLKHTHTHTNPPNNGLGLLFGWAY